MVKPKKIIDARADNKGKITHVRIDGNSRFTPMAQAVSMCERGELDRVHVVNPRDGREKYLRTNPDNKRNNNLDDMAGDN